MTIVPVEFASPDYDQTVRLRFDVLREPLGLDFTVADLEEEYRSHHLAGFDADFQLLACLVLHPLGESAPGQIKMRQVAVAEAAQGKGMGTHLVRASEAYARELGYTEMVLHARSVAVPFYLRLDYETVGEPFVEVSIEHYRMRKVL
ncbi:MAG: GNAT family N-acetyltransferase [Bacteroidota bacterium]